MVADMQEGAGTTSGADPAACRTCGVTLTTTFYRINGRPTCPSCREQVGGSWGRMAAFAVGAGLVNAAIYYGLLYGADFRLVISPILAGVLVGSAVRRGAGVEHFWGMRMFAVVAAYFAAVATYVHSVWDLQSVSLFGDALVRSLVLPVVMAIQGKNIVSLVLLAIGLHEAFVFARPAGQPVKGPFPIEALGEDDMRFSAPPMARTPGLGAEAADIR